MAGTPCYISPEVFENRYYTKNGDIWACGILLYILLVGYMPYPQTDTRAVKNILSKGKFDFFGYEEWNDVTPQAKDLISKMLVFDPVQRITARQVLKHPWVFKRDTVPARLHRSRTIDGLKEFNKARRKWKTLGRTVMMTNKFKRLITEGTKDDGNCLLKIPSSITENPETTVFELSTNIKKLSKKMPTNVPDEDLRHYEADFIVDVIAVTQSITEAKIYNNTELYSQLSAPDCTNIIPAELPMFKGQRVSVNNPIVHMIGMNGACISYTKQIMYVDVDGKYVSVNIPETRVWKNFDGKWMCLHYHTS